MSLHQSFLAILVIALAGCCFLCTTETICQQEDVTQVSATEGNMHGWKVYLPTSRSTAYKGGPIPQSHYDGLSKILKFTNSVISEKLVGNAAAATKVLAMMQKAPIVLAGSGMGWSISGMLGSCKEAENTGCVLGLNYEVMADHFLDLATAAKDSTKTLGPLVLHELAHVFDRSLLVNKASFDSQFGIEPNEYSRAKAVRAAYVGSNIFVQQSSGENTVKQAALEALGYDVITQAQNEVCEKGQHYCGSGGTQGKWTGGQMAGGAACLQKTKSKCFVGNPAGPNDGKDDYAFSTSLEYLAELTESITQGTTTDGITMGANDKWPYNNANLKKEDPTGFAAVSAMWNLTEEELDCALKMKCGGSCGASPSSSGSTNTSGSTSTDGSANTTSSSESANASGAEANIASALAWLLPLTFLNILK